MGSLGDKCSFECVCWDLTFESISDFSCSVQGGLFGIVPDQFGVGNDLVGTGDEGLVAGPGSGGTEGASNDDLFVHDLEEIE